LRLRPVDEALAQRTSPFAPEVAAILDEDSMCHLTGGSAIAVRPLIYEARAALGRSGAPYGQYLMEDALAGKVPARLQLFLSAWRVAPEQLAALQAQREAGFLKSAAGWLGLGRGSDVTRVWCWAPGALAGGAEAVTGFRTSPKSLASAEVTPTGVGRAHGLARSWGPKAKIEPLYCAEAAPDEVWATYADGSPAVAVRRTRTGHDVFIGVPQLTPELVHALAKLAGAHCYSEPGPALWAANGYLSVQAQTNGVVRLDTGGKGPVTDALDGRPLGRGPRVELNMDAGDVRVIQY
jgi:hypothetical protein